MKAYTPTQMFRDLAAFLDHVLLGTRKLPHIRPAEIGGGYVCHGPAHGADFAFGDTPKEAYDNWNRSRA